MRNRSARALGESTTMRRLLANSPSAAKVGACVGVVCGLGREMTSGHAIGVAEVLGATIGGAAAGAILFAAIGWAWRSK